MHPKEKMNQSAIRVMLLLVAILTAACGTAQPSGEDLVRAYYTAIEAGDAEAAAALFAEDARIVTPSGNTLSGDAVAAQFIPYDLNFMDEVHFETDFLESDGKVTWSQEYHHAEGDVFASDCEVTVREGKIVEWLFN